jgi:hypothetical protein
MTRPWPNHALSTLRSAATEDICAGPLLTPQRFNDKLHYGRTGDLSR